MSDKLYKKVMNVIAELEKIANFMEPDGFYGGMWVGETVNGDNFMYPADYFTKEDVINEEGADNIAELELVEGWWGRMSAPGYMDQTDWIGPYKDEEEVLEALQEMYGFEEDVEEY